MDVTGPVGGSELLTVLKDEVAYLMTHSAANLSAPVGDFYAVPLLDDAPQGWLDVWGGEVNAAVDEFRSVDATRADELTEFQVEDVMVLQPSFRFDALDYYLANEGMVEVALGAGFSPAGSLPAVLLVGGRVVLLDGTHRFLATVTAGRSTFFAVPLGDAS